METTRENGRDMFHRQSGFEWARMSKDEINEYPIKSYQGPIHLVRTAEELEAAVSKLQNESLLGFDTETRPAYCKGETYLPALLQLAGSEDVYIFQLKHIGLPAPLLKILSSPDIVKAGVSLNFDIKELRKIDVFKPAGFVDIAELAKKIGIQNHGLRGLAAVLLGFRISKSSRTSNWERKSLSPAQIQYAATDAWVGRELYNEIRRIEQKISS